MFLMKYIFLLATVNMMTEIVPFSSTVATTVKETNSFKSIMQLINPN